MVTVTMDIAELDKLRSDLKEKEVLVQDYISKEKVVKIIITGLEWYTRSYYGSLVMDRRKIEEITYINFSEVKDELRKEAESRVIDKLSMYEKDIKDLRQEKENIRNNLTSDFKIKEDNYKKEILLLKENQVEKTKDLKIEEQNKELSKLYTSIGDLNREIFNLKNRNWYQRLFNL